jgi:hypothetical protein
MTFIKNESGESVWPGIATPKQKQKLLNYWEKIAGEKLDLVDFETIYDARTVFGSELACLRLDRKYKDGHRKIGKSPTEGRWFFTLY